MRAGPRQRGYTRRWDVAAARFKRLNPLCAACLKRGLYVPAYAVDHIVPHRGNAELMWDQSNWQSLCRECHNRDKQHEERKGYSDELGLDGLPVDRRHPFYR
jgi:5-methylcytosine-specific restriction enzyme A